MFLSGKIWNVTYARNSLSQVEPWERILMIALPNSNKKQKNLPYPFPVQLEPGEIYIGIHITHNDEFTALRRVYRGDVGL